MYDRLLRHCFFPIIDRLGLLPKGFWEKTQELLRVQYLSKRELERRQMQKLRRILQHSYNKVPFYRRSFKERGISPNDIKSVEDMRKLPVTTKTDLARKFPSGVIANDLSLRNAKLMVTSGTSGIPFTFYEDVGAETVGHILASRFMFNQMAGIKPGEKCIHLSTTIDPIMKFMHEGHISTLGKSKKDVPQIKALIEENKPSGISGLLSMLLLLANQIEEFNQPLGIRPKAVITTSEILFEEYRERIKRSFDCPVFDRYGSRELSGYLAQECSYHEGLHINTEFALLEVVKDEEPVAPGERGRIVVTALHNFVMPFIRYDIGDFATRGNGCSCGRSLPTIEGIEGRFAHSLEGLGGELLPLLPIKSQLARIFAKTTKQLQFVQDKPGKVTLLIMTSKFTARDQELISNFLKKITDSIKFTVEVVEEIPANESGKRPVLKRRY